MMIAFIIVLLCLQAHFAENISIDTTNRLTKLDCSYDDARFGHINLSPVGLKHGVPAFRHIVKDDYAYSYNPCYPFSDKDPCINVAICQIAKDESAYYTLGYNSLVSWSVKPDGTVTLVYSSGTRQTIVNLVCHNEIDQLVINGEYELRQYNLTLFSKCACWNGC